MTTLQQLTGVTVSWLQCTVCGGSGPFFLATGALAPAMTAATLHVERAHPGQSPLDVLDLHTEDAAVTRSTASLDRDNPGPWLDRLNGALPAWW
ncbi:hypothetical protein [Streptomyces sp. NPDC091278]|uniref:hypothetical protein n=1 Tax=Streptomyces sp. NPDC091278 TaxID=3155301 RepID=UPI00344BB696